MLPQTSTSNGGKLNVETGFNVTSNNAIDDLNDSLAKFKGYMHQSISENPSPVNSVGTSSTNSTNFSSISADTDNQNLQSKFSNNDVETVGNQQSNQIKSSNPHTQTQTQTHAQTHAHAHAHAHHHHHHHRTSRVLKLFKYKHHEHGSCSSDDISTCKEGFGTANDERNLDVQASFASLKYQQQASELEDPSKQKKTKRSYSSRILHYATGNSLRSKNSGASPINNNGQNNATFFLESAPNDANLDYHQNSSMQTSKTRLVESPSAETSTSPSVPRNPVFVENLQSKNTSSPCVIDGQTMTSFNNSNNQTQVPSPVIYSTRAGSSPLVDQHYAMNMQVYSRPTSALKRSKSYTISDPPYSPYGFNHTNNKSFATLDGTSPAYAASTLSASSARFGDSSDSTFSPVLSRFSQAPIIHSPLNTSTSAFPNACSNMINNKSNMVAGSTNESSTNKNPRFKRSNTFGETSLMNMQLQQQQHMKQGLLAKSLTTESRSASNTNTNITSNSDTQDDNELFEYGETESAKNIHIIADADDENDASVAFNKVFSSASNSFSNLNLPSAPNSGTQFLDSVPTPHTNKHTAHSAAGTLAGPLHMSTHSKPHYISRRKRTNTCGSTNSRTSISTNASSVVKLSPIRRSTSPNRSVGNTTLNTGSNVSSLKSQHQQQQHWSSISSGSSSIMSSNIRSNSSSNLLQISTASSIYAPNTANNKGLGTDTYLDQNSNVQNNLGGNSQPLPPVPQLLNTTAHVSTTQPILQLPSSVVRSSKSRMLKNAITSSSSAGPQKTEKSRASTQNKMNSLSMRPGTKHTDLEMQGYPNPSDEYLQPPNSATTITSAGHEMPMDDERTVYSHSTTTPVDLSQGSGLADVGEDPEFMNLMSLMEITHPSSSEELSSAVDGKNSQNAPQATVQELEDLESELDLNSVFKHKDGENASGNTGPLADNMENRRYFTSDALDRHKDDVLMLQDNGIEELSHNDDSKNNFPHTHSGSEFPLGRSGNESDEMMQMMLDLPELPEDFDQDYFLINETEDI